MQIIQAFQVFRLLENIDQLLDIVLRATMSEHSWRDYIQLASFRICSIALSRPIADLACALIQNSCSLYIRWYNFILPPQK